MPAARKSQRLPFIATLIALCLMLNLALAQCAIVKDL